MQHTSMVRATVTCGESFSGPLDGRVVDRQGRPGRALRPPPGRDRPRVTTDQLADIVMEGLAEERFLINTHPWVLEKFALKARDYDAYIRMLRGDQEAAKVAA